MPPCEGSPACPSGQEYTPIIPTFARQAQGRFDRARLERLFQALFDLSFRRFITLRLTGILHAIALGWSLAGFGESLGQGFLRLVALAPLGFLLYAIWVRIVLEASVSLIRVAQNTSDILEELRKKP
ncbi:DUF4282 domain-containing protein [Thermus aquaticus]|uniref:DUF4282 domain-containing protein n=1 Tax=Thermus aquaticus TaxID=271 RepID=UPI00017E40FD|nr:DUF4282 domain-containing protein [Thermus aquaticus]